MLKTVTAAGVERTTVPLPDAVTERTTGCEDVEMGISVIVLVLVENIWCSTEISVVVLEGEVVNESVLVIIFVVVGVVPLVLIEPFVVGLTEE